MPQMSFRIHVGNESIVSKNESIIYSFKRKNKMNKTLAMLLASFCFHTTVYAQLKPLPAQQRVKFDILKNDYTLNDLMVVKDNTFVTVNFHLPSMNGVHPFVLKKNGDTFTLNGDIEINPIMLLPPQQVRSLGSNDTNYVIFKERWRWRDGEIPIELSPEITGPTYDAIKQAIDELNSKTILRIVKRTNQEHYVKVFYDKSIGGDGKSPIGWQGGKQPLRIKSPEVKSSKVVMHELLHAAGIYHEQSRHDRDKYITIHFDKIKKEEIDNFQIESNTTTYSPYDFCSIMHYSESAFAKNLGDITISVNDPNNKAAVQCLKQDNGISENDIRGLQSYYNISRFPSNIKYYQTPIGLIGQKWLAMGAENSKIGLPMHWEKTTPDGVGKYVFFDKGGAIYYHPSIGTHEVSGEILKEWARQGYEAGRLGYPISDEKPLTVFNNWGEIGYTAYSSFQRGVIIWNPRTKKCKVLTKAEFDAGPEQPLTDSAKKALERSETSPITKSAIETTKSISDLIFEKAAASKLGPVHSESAKPRPTEGNGGYYLRFEKGWVYYNPTLKKAFALSGPIVTEWGKLNYETGKLGFPISDVILLETSYDGYPYYCGFEGGKISWGPSKGAVVTFK